MLEQRFSDNDLSRRDIPSFIEPRPPLIQNPFMRPRPQKGTNLLELFEEDSEIEEPELVQVYLRLKPCNVPNTLYEVRSDRCLVTSLDTATAGHGRRTQHNVSKMYTFSKIFGPECNQKQIFEQVVKDNLKKLPDGHSFTLLTYGASGSGKTYTLMGTVGAPGLVPRALEYVFRLVDAAQQPAYKPGENGAEKLNYAEQDFELQWVKRLRHVSAPLRDKYRRMSAQLHTDLTISSIDLSNRQRHYVWVSFVEIYNEAIYDLLAPPEKRVKLRIREDSSGNVYVKGATQAFVRSGEEAYDVMVAGKHNLIVAATGVHAQSSRSHCIFTITMLTETEGGPRTSCVRLCDLAGCERARATRNTGARMQESRAINSSLHVLERCLHMLRRKQRTRNDALVPYRESKLTRLLGTGLSGAKGEAVSMVVTLNPSPEYAHETKHVLTLAAVAQDIQINNTIFGSTLENITPDTTINCSNEVMKLRSDNERLHFELVQAQARNKELLAAMEERQQETANTMRELVEEAKDMTRQYYEAQLEALRSEMDDMVEEYEARLSKQSKKEATASGTGTPSRYLQSKVTQLMTEITVLEEQLTAERLARARTEKEVQHLRTCIEERDEKAFKDMTPPQDVLSSDSEQESDDETSDPLNESLEPIFKKEMNKSMAKQNDTASVHTIDNIDEEDNEINDESCNTIRADDSNNETINDTNDAIKDSKVTTINDTSDAMKDSAINDVNSDETETPTNISDNTAVDSANSTYNDATADNNYESANDTVDKDNTRVKYDENTNYVCRGTYFVSDSKEDDIVAQETKSSSLSRGTYFVRASTDATESDKVIELETDIQKPLDNKLDKIAERVSETIVSRIMKSFKSTQSSDTSLRQFEQLEIASKVCDDTVQIQSIFGDIKMLKEKRTYFDNEPVADRKNTADMPVVVAKEKRTYFDNIDVNVEVNSKKINEIKTIDEERSPSIVKETIASDNFEPSKIKKLLGESFTKPDIVTSVQKLRLAKKHESVDLFESPMLHVTEKTDNIELARQSIEQLVLNQKSAKKASHFDIEHKSDIKTGINLTSKKTDEPTPFVKDTLDPNANIDIEKLIRNQASAKKATYMDIEPKSAVKIGINATSKPIDDPKLLVKDTQETNANIDIEKLVRNQASAKKATYMDIEPKSAVKIGINATSKPIDDPKLLVKDTQETNANIDVEKLVLNLKSAKTSTHIDIEPKFAVKTGINLTSKKIDDPTHLVKDTQESNSNIDIDKLVLNPKSAKKSIPMDIESKSTAKADKAPKKYDYYTPLVKHTQEPIAKIDLPTPIQDTVKSAKKADVPNKIQTETVKNAIKIKKEFKLEPTSSIEDEYKDIKKEVKLEPASSIDVHNQNETSKDNTIEEFENIYKDITAPRATDFELLISQNETDKITEKEETKYNLRKKNSKTDDLKSDKSNVDNNDEILLESQAKCESKGRRRNLRLRRRKNQSEEDSEKLKDIVNLQSEYSDVTMDIPAPHHKAQPDIPSPEKGVEENLPPILGIQSCPAKSITRSRRKLFTPRAEPLEESLSQTGDSNERVYVPRPSYHRPRARRKL